MTDDPVLVAVQKFMDAVEARMTAQSNEIRGLLDQLETRAVPKVIDGLPGKDGKDGANGKDGRDGNDGKDGAPGTNGKDGAIGERGVDGLNGKDGAPSTIPGPKGDPGERGADGIATREELQSLVKAEVADFQVRTLADLYRDVWKQGEVYHRSEIVTWDGQPWMALKETSSAPSTSPDWKLFVKKGRDGRDKR